MVKAQKVRAAKRPVDNSLAAQVARETRRVERLAKDAARANRKLKAARFRKQVLMRMANNQAVQLVGPAPMMEVFGERSKKLEQAKAEPAPKHGPDFLSDVINAPLQKPVKVKAKKKAK